MSAQADSGFGKQCYEKQFALIRALDKTRPCSFASCKFKTDISFGLPDVVSYNIYPKWYHDTPVDAYLNDLYTWVQEETEGKGKPFLVTEIGAGGIYGYRTPMRANGARSISKKHFLNNSQEYSPTPTVRAYISGSFPISASARNGGAEGRAR